MPEFFTKSIGFKLSSKERLAGIFPDEIYLETNQNVNTLLAIYEIINIVSDKSNN